MRGARYASGTKTTAAVSLEDLERVIYRYGGDNLDVSEGATRTFIEFSYRERRIRFAVPMPPAVRPGEYSWKEDADAARKEREAEIRRRWRALVLIAKALLEAVESEILNVDEAFMGETVMPDAAGATVYEVFSGQVRAAYERRPLALPAPR